MNIQCPLEHVAVHLYLVLAAVLGHLDPLLEELDPDVVSLCCRRTRPQLHVLCRGQWISLESKFIMNTDNDWMESMIVIYLLRLCII